MAYKIIIQEHAKEDTEIAYNHYEDEKIGLGEDFLDELEKRYYDLSSKPYNYGFIDDRAIIRDVKLDRFPYVIVFEIVDNSKQGFASISQRQLNGLVKTIEFYKLQHGQYPDSLKQLSKDDPFVPIDDAIQFVQGRLHTDYNYQKIGDKYVLFSSGQDGIPNTKDDLYPQITIEDSSKIGLIRPIK